MAFRYLFSVVLWFSVLISTVTYGYEQPFSDKDEFRQICSGMWADDKTYLNVTFDRKSAGQLAVIIYDFKDFDYIGKSTDPNSILIPKTYICTSDAVRSNLCTDETLGEFIIDLPKGVTLNSTSIWTKSMRFAWPQPAKPNSTHTSTGGAGFWDNPAGNPTPPPSADDKYTSPWLWRRDTLQPRAPENVMWVDQHIYYPVRRQGYYCIGIVPVTIVSPTQNTAPSHATYKGVIHYHNVFDGHLAATDYPKIKLYLALTTAYVFAGGAWAFLCWTHRTDLLPIQNYISYLFGLLVIEMLATWTYYRYLNAHGEGTPTTVFLFVVAILGAGRNSLSFFLLLVVSLGLSVVREELPMMMRCRLLAVAHFVFGVLYAVGIVEIELDTVSAAILLLFVIPLAWTMTSFLLWTMYALNATIKELSDRKQRYKMSMFVKLNRILMGAVFVVLIFFVVSSMSFFNRQSQDYLPNSWAYRWWLLDGWLALLYYSAFCAIAYIWRPTGHNRRLAMSDELAQEEEDAEDYDLESMGHSRLNQSEAELGDERRKDLDDDGVMFEIGEEDGEDGSESDDEDEDKHGRSRNRDERAGLMGNSGAQRAKDRSD